MTSSRSKTDLHLCVICGDKKVTVSSNSETGRKLITNLLRCLSLVQLKSEGETLENINLCFKCKYTVEEWTYAQGEAGSGFFANRARQIKASLLVKILESTRKSSASSASSLVERIQRMIYDRFNVAVNVDRLELSQEQMDQISAQELVRPENQSNDYEESEASEAQDDLEDDSSSGASSSDVQIWEDESDDEVVEILPKKSRTSRSTKIRNDKSQLIDSRKNHIDYNLTRQARRTDEGAGPADIDPVELFQKNHPMPPDFIPKKHKPESYLYGKCSVKEYENQVECSECSLSVPMETDGVSSWWKIREHMRNEHPELVPCIPPLKELGVKSIGQDKFQYGQATMTKFLESDMECYKCDACGESFRTKFAKKCCIKHIRTHHSQLARFNPYFQERPIFVKQNLIRYAGAYLEKLSETKIMCQICSLVSTGQHAQKSSILHVRKNHSILAPVEISAILQTNPEAIHLSNTKTVDNRHHNKSRPVMHSVLNADQDDDALGNSAEQEQSETQSVEQARQDDNVAVEKFQLKNPIPPDFIPNTLISGNYHYGKCSAKKIQEEVNCGECSLSIPMETDGLSSWWKIREHMRNEHPELAPCIHPVKELGVKSIGEDKFQYGIAKLTKFLESDVECYKCDACGESFRTKFAQQCCTSHIRRHHPELAPFNPYYLEKPVFVNQNLIRYAGAYLEKLSETKVMCQVCSFMSNGKHAQNASIVHVRKNHSILAPVKISAILPTISEAVQSSNTENVDNSCATSLPVSSVSVLNAVQDDTLENSDDEEKSEVQIIEEAGQDNIDAVEEFQLKNPIPPDFIADALKSGHYRYGKCIAEQVENEVKCCECSLSVPMETDGLSSWWKIREHMRNEHPKLVPCITPMADLGLKFISGDKYQYGQISITKFMESDVECYKCDSCGALFQTKCAKKHCMRHVRERHREGTPSNPKLQEKAVYVAPNLIRYAAAYLLEKSDMESICQVCSLVHTGQNVLQNFIYHVRKQHSILAPLDTSRPKISVDLVEKFQLNHPIPPDFIPNRDRIGNYIYGKCSATEHGDQVKCSECNFSVPMRTHDADGLSSWWEVREHMREEHSEHVPCIPPLERKNYDKDKYEYGQVTMTRVVQLEEERFMCSVCRSTFGSKHAKIAFITHVRRKHPELARYSQYYQEQPVFLKKNQIRYGAAYLKTLSDREVMCQVCSSVLTDKKQPESLVMHVRVKHPVLAPVVIGRTLTYGLGLQQSQRRHSPAGTSSVRKETLQKLADKLKLRARTGNSLTEASSARSKRKRGIESSKKATGDGKGSACDEDSGSVSPSDKSDDSEEEVFIPNVYRRDYFECPLCGDRRDLKSNFIVHLKWHAGDVDEDSPRKNYP